MLGDMVSRFATSFRSFCVDIRIRAGNDRSLGFMN